MVEHAPNWSGHAAPGLQISVGSLSFTMDEDVGEELDAGIKLAVLLEGQFDLSISGDRPRQIAGSSASLFMGGDRWRLDHRFGSGTKLAYLTLHLDAALIEDELDLHLGRSLGSSGGVAMVSGPIPSAIFALTRQMAHSPYSGSLRRLHLAGKGLELAAIAIDHFLHAPGATAAPLATPAETRRLYELADWIARHPCDIPPLDKLARQAGLNVRKLNAGFRRLLGKSVMDHVRDVRMEEAHRLLSAGARVTDVADNIGYTLPHFTTAFRQRYGITPRQLIGRDLR